MKQRNLAGLIAVVLVSVVLISMAACATKVYGSNMDPGSGGYSYHNTGVPCGTGRTYWYEHYGSGINRVICALYPPHYWGGYLSNMDPGGGGFHYRQVNHWLFPWVVYCYQHLNWNHQQFGPVLQFYDGRNCPSPVWEVG